MIYFAGREANMMSFSRPCADPGKRGARQRRTMGEQQSEQTLRAYLAPDYLHDVFVTYSHGDFEGTGESELKAWSQRLARKLESKLRQIPKFKNAVVFLDESKRAEHRLDKTLPLTDQIRVI
jgi:ribonuclease BN (tRNA processing enzyme)